MYSPGSREMGIDLTSWSKTGEGFEYVVEVKKIDPRTVLKCREHIVAKDYDDLMAKASKQGWEIVKLIMVFDG